MLASTIFWSALFCCNCDMERKRIEKSWKWEKIRSEEKEYYVILATLWLCSPITAFLCISHKTKQWGTWRALSDKKHQQGLCLYTPDSKVFQLLFLSEIESEICGLGWCSWGAVEKVQATQFLYKTIILKSSLSQPDPSAEVYISRHFSSTPLSENSQNQYI